MVLLIHVDRKAATEERATGRGAKLICVISAKHCTLRCELIDVGRERLGRRRVEPNTSISKIVDKEVHNVRRRRADRRAACSQIKQELQ
jgi:hypothetical protein